MCPPPPNSQIHLPNPYHIRSFLLFAPLSTGHSIKWEVLEII
jgi:hypothetical protein